MSVLLPLGAMISTSSPTDSFAPEALSHPSHIFEPRFTVGSPRLSARHRTLFDRAEVVTLQPVMYDTVSNHLFTAPPSISELSNSAAVGSNSGGFLKS